MQGKELNSKKKIMVSACLLGIKCRYDGKNKRNTNVIEYCKDAVIIPFCPEQLGGLSTPRIKATITKEGNVVNDNGEDVTENFKRGARETLLIISMIKPDEIILKEGSPSCGLTETNINWERKKGSGVTTTLLKQKTDIPLKSELLLQS
ncbi:MAG: DUF523 domain-containing protein [Proteobacteria bacterium]|nr:DUF523 domain-containing protein [Pseudomonadota bacterium]